MKLDVVLSVEDNPRNTSRQIAKVVITDSEVLSVEDNPHNTSRQIAADTGISQRSLLRILKDEKQHP